MNEPNEEKYRIKKSGKVTCSFDLPLEIVQKLDDRHKKTGVSKSFQVTKALSKYFKMEPEEELEKQTNTTQIMQLQCSDEYHRTCQRQGLFKCPTCQVIFRTEQ